MHWGDGHGEEGKGGQEIWGKHKHENLSALGLIWVGKAEPGSQGQGKVRMKAQECQDLCIWSKTVDLHPLGVELSGAGVLWELPHPRISVEGESLQCLEPPGISSRIFGSEIQGWTRRTCGVSILGDAPAPWNIPELWGPGELKLSQNFQPRSLFLT